MNLKMIFDQVVAPDDLFAHEMLLSIGILTSVCVCRVYIGVECD